MPIQPYLNPKRPGCWVGLAAAFFERGKARAHCRLYLTLPYKQVLFIILELILRLGDYRDCSALSLSFWVADSSRYVKDNLPTLWVQVCTQGRVRSGRRYRYLQVLYLGTPDRIHIKRYNMYIHKVHTWERVVQA